MSNTTPENSDVPPEENAPAVVLRCFGVFHLAVAGREVLSLSRAAKELLALLVLRGEQHTARVWLASSLWPDAPRERALYYLRRTLTEIRAALGPERDRLLSPDTAHLRFETRGMNCDVLDFDRRIKHKTEGELAASVALYHGGLLENHEAEWISNERAVRAEQYLSALETLAEMREQSGDTQGAMQSWARVIAADALRESAYRHVMRLQAQAGDAAGMEKLYRELRRRLWNDLHLEPTGETAALYKQLHAQARALPEVHAENAAPDAVLSPRRLPVPLTSLVGRVAEREAVQEAVQTYRLVTLVGPGGVGKTRLSLLAAENLRENYTDGVFFADLTPAKTADEAALALLNALAAAVDSEVPPDENLRRVLHSRRLLLILDNAEHIADIAAKIAAELLQNCPALAIVCTSRQPLFVSGESVLPVAPLAVPDLPERFTDAAEYAQTLPENEAAALLLDRVRTSAPHFRLTAKNAPDVARICRQLDGLPLALELAAARFRSLSPADIADRLESKIKLLSSGDVNLPRHRTLHAALDWSYDLLDEAEKRLLRHLALFRGGWTLEAAESVCPVEVEETDVLLSALVDKSLVVYETTADGIARYRLLEMTRQYAIERLDDGERAALQARLAAHYLQLAQDAHNAGDLSGSIELVNALHKERDNFRTAHAWYLERDPDSALWLEFFLYVIRVWTASHAREWVARIKSEPMPVTPLGLLVTFQTACWALWQSDAAAEMLFQRVLSDAETCGNILWQIHAINLLVYMELERGNHSPVVEYSERMLALLPADADLYYRSNVIGRAALSRAKMGQGDSTRAAMEQMLADGRYHDRWETIFPALNALADIAFEQGDYAAACDYGKQCLPYTETHQPSHLPNQYRGMARSAAAQKDYAAAWDYFEAGLEVSRRTRAFDREGWIRFDMAEIAFQQGNRAEAQAHLCASIAVFQACHEPHSVARCLVRMARFSAAWDCPERAAVLLGSVERAHAEYKFAAPAKEQQGRADLAAEVRRAMDSAAWQTAWERGRTMTLEQARAYAEEQEAAPRKQTLSAVSPESAAAR